MSKTTIEIKLKNKIKYNGVDITKLKMLAPRVHHSLSADKAGGTPAEKEVMLFASLCEVEVELLHQLFLSDYSALQGAYQDFLS